MSDAPNPELTASAALHHAIEQAIRALAEEAAAYDPPIAHVVAAHEALSTAYRAACASRPEITDAERYRWVRPVLVGGPNADARTLLIGKMLMRGLDGDEVVDAAIREERSRNG